MKKVILLAALLPLGFTAMKAQSTSPEKSESWYFGLTGGYRHTFVNFTDIDKTLYPSTTGNDNGIFSVFLKKSFGESQHLAIRPEVAILARGGGLKNIFSETPGYYEKNDIKDVIYQVNSRYVDFRIPVMWQFNSPTARIRPYAYVAPVLGFCTGGSIVAETQNHTTDTDKAYMYSGLHLDITKANMNSFYFAGAVGLGLDWNFNIEGNPFYLGLEAMYEYGFTDTYGKDADAARQYHLTMAQQGTIKSDGSRKFSGMEVKLTLGIPFSVFHKKPQMETPERVVYVDRIVEKIIEKEPVVDSRCYSLEEINDMMIRGESVQGKTICAIDAITFETGKSKIEPSSYEYLNTLAETLKKTNSKIMVKGHTDNVGSEEFNMNLSRDRAMSVVDYLLKRGVKRANLSYDYFGMTQPLSTNDTEEGRSMNRRVEFEIL